MLMYKSKRVIVYPCKCVNIGSENRLFFFIFSIIVVTGEQT